MCYMVDIIRDGEILESFTYDNREDAIGAYSEFRRSYGHECIIKISCVQN
jgi:hypothetical protein